MNITTTPGDYVQLLTCLAEVWGEAKQYLPEYSDRYNNRMHDAMSYAQALELGQSYGKGL